MAIDNRERPFEVSGDQRYVLAEPAARIVGVGHAYHQKIISLAGLACDRSDRALLPRGDIDVPVPLLLRIGLQRQRTFGRNLDLVLRWLLVRLLGSAARLRGPGRPAVPSPLIATAAAAQVENRSRLAACAGDHPGQSCRQRAVRTVIGGEQKPLEVRYKSAGVELLAFEPYSL